MRKLAGLLAVAVAATAVVAAPAAAQKPETEFFSKTRVVPKKAGTKRKPRGVQLRGKMRFKTITQGVEPPIVTGGDILIPKYGKYNGGKYPRCSKRTMTRNDSVDDCPKRSIMGKGSGVAFADTVDTEPTVDFVNGGKKRLWAFTTLYNPALIQEPIAINIKRLRSRKWGYRASFKVPKKLQLIAGVPVTLRSFSFRVGRKPYARNFFVTTGCPRSKRYPYKATAHYLYNDGSRSKDTFTGKVPCR